MRSEEMVAYMAKVNLVREAMVRLGRGTQQEAAFDIRVSPSLVSSILNGRWIDEEKLDQLAAWVERKLAETAPVAAG
jgi:transcriptional regulator with XRE-family HTH domain